ncbi:hypothetical protein Cni_G03806 [Canna indica]|uniref:Uncharacterized protein n=1 Tax=Canna indica TaxID=4628 RepID=A0AAQ3JU80_9LILI|nr:hypothetical protein Cni_G03806 [Canna indica]
MDEFENWNLDSRGVHCNGIAYASSFIRLPGIQKKARARKKARIACTCIQGTAHSTSPLSPQRDGERWRGRGVTGGISCRFRIRAITRPRKPTKTNIASPPAGAAASPTSVFRNQSSA